MTLFKEADDAKAFLKANNALLRPRNAWRGLSRTATIALADSLLKRYPSLAKHIHKDTLNQIKCERCGCVLTAPESVAAGIGPECMDK